MQPISSKTLKFETTFFVEYLKLHQHLRFRFEQNYHQPSLTYPIQFQILWANAFETIRTPTMSWNHSVKWNVWRRFNANSSDGKEGASIHSKKQRRNCNIKTSLNRIQLEMQYTSSFMCNKHGFVRSLNENRRRQREGKKNAHQQNECLENNCMVCSRHRIANTLVNCESLTIISAQFGKQSKSISIYEKMRNTTHTKQ